MFGAPLAEVLLQTCRWQEVFVIFAALILSSLFDLPFIRSPHIAIRMESEASMGTVRTRAFKSPFFGLIFLGFFSCSYQLAFVTAPFPTFMAELCGPIDPGGTWRAEGSTPHPTKGLWRFR